LMPLFGWLHLIQQEYIVIVPTWDDANKVAGIVEDGGYDVQIVRI
jgi:hypothetical protein